MAEQVTQDQKVPGSNPTWIQLDPLQIFKVFIISHQIRLGFNKFEALELQYNSILRS